MKYDKPETWENAEGLKASLFPHLGAYHQVVCPGFLLHGEVGRRDDLADRLLDAGFRKYRG